MGRTVGANRLDTVLTAKTATRMAVKKDLAVMLFTEEMKNRFTFQKKLSG